MKKLLVILRWLLLVIVALVVLFIAFVYVKSGGAIERKWEISQAAVMIPATEESVIRGQHIARTRACQECHAEDYGGKVVIDDPAMGFLYGPNITPGEGSVTRSYSTSDWVRTIRHGIAPSGRSLVLMPTEDYYFLDDEDLGALIAYLRTLPPADRPTKASKIGPIGRAMIAVGVPLLSADKVDHDLPIAKAPSSGANPEYGEYLATMCIGCHGHDFAGGKIPTGDPSWPPSQNITMHESGLAAWDLDDFTRLLREGIKPDGTELHEAMPRAFGHFTDDEIEAIWLYLQTVPPQPQGMIPKTRS